MKIIIATDNYYPHINGASLFAQRLAFHLKKQGHSVLVIAPSLTTHSEFSTTNGIRIFGIRSVPILMYRGFRVSLPFFMKKRMEEIIQEFDPDIIHFQGHFYISKAVLSIAQKLKIPTLGTNHFMPENAIHYLHLPKFAENPIKRWAWKQFHSAFERMDIVTCPTETAVQVVRSNHLRKNAMVVSNGVDLSEFHAGNDGTYLKEKYKLPDEPILLYVGRLDKEKNIDMILRALALVTKRINVHFVVAGDGEEKAELRNSTKDLNLEKLVTFTGYVLDEDLRNIYRIADCFVIAGAAELQSIVTMEAMASGLPVIALNALALPELVKPGVNGYLFEFNDINGLAQDIMRIFSDDSLRKKMAAESLELIKDHRIENTVHKFESLYQSLLKKNK
ncbi:MAG: glycosyltransferase [Candidatus Zixiibacteriota bacterium]